MRLLPQPNFIRFDPICGCCHSWTLQGSIQVCTSQNSVAQKTPMRGLPSQVKGARLRALSRRSTRVRITSPALSTDAQKVPLYGFKLAMWCPRHSKRATVPGVRLSQRRWESVFDLDNGRKTIKVLYFVLK